jgi:hypothetical protein
MLCYLGRKRRSIDWKPWGVRVRVRVRTRD